MTKEPEFDKNKELVEKQEVQLEFEEKRNVQKKNLLNHEHELKMERLNKRLEIAKITGQDIEE